jgi:hypothetical protein
MKAIRQAQTRNILDAYDRGDISYSRMNELFNELSDKFAIGFAEWYEEQILAKGDYNMIDKPKKELLQIYKKEQNL